MGNKRFVIASHTIDCKIEDKYIEQYVTYRFGGFICKNSTSLEPTIKISQHMKKDCTVEKLVGIPAQDDFIFFDETCYANVVNFNSYIFWQKNEMKIAIYLGDGNELLKKILSIKLVSVVLAVLVQYDVLCLHAAGIGYRNHGILIMGNSGSGKTSMALKWANDGACLTNDDATFMRCTDASYLAIKNTQLIGLTQNGINEEFPEYRSSVSCQDDDGKCRINLYDCHAIHYGDSIKITDIILLENREDREPVIAISPKLHIIKYILSNISACQFINYNRYVNYVLDLVKRCQTFRFFPSNNLTESYFYLKGGFD